MTILRRSIADQIGAFSGRPSAGISGRKYYSTDGGLVAVDDGANWRPLLAGTVGTAPGAASGFSWNNQGTASAADSNGSIILTAPGTAGAGKHLLYKAKASVAFAEVAGSVITTGIGANQSRYPSLGAVLLEQSTGAYAWCQLVHNIDSQSGAVLTGGTYLNYGSNGGNGQGATSTDNFTIPVAGAYVFTRIEISGTTVTVKASRQPRSDGTTNWVTLGTFVRNFTTAFDASGAIFSSEQGTDFTGKMSWDHFRTG